MSNLRDTVVEIAGKKRTLTSCESEEYIKKLADYVNKKIYEFSKFGGRQDEFQTILMINMADDYYKALGQVDELNEKIRDMENQLSEIKHEIVSYQMKAESNKKTISNLEGQLSDAQKKIMRLETELRN